MAGKYSWQRGSREPCEDFSHANKIMVYSSWRIGVCFHSVIRWNLSYFCRTSVATPNLPWPRGGTMREESLLVEKPTSVATFSSILVLYLLFTGTRWLVVEGFSMNWGGLCVSLTCEVILYLVIIPFFDSWPICCKKV